MVWLISYPLPLRGNSLIIIELICQKLHILEHGESDVDKHNTTEIHGELLGSDIDILADNEVFDDNDNDNDDEDKFGFYNQK